MRMQLDHEVAELLAQLAPEWRRQVLEYAQWLRDEEHADARLWPRAAGEQDRPDAGLEGVLEGLDCAQRERVEAYVQALAADPPRGVPGHVLLRFAGTIPESALRQIEQAIEEEFEKIDEEGW